MGTRARPDSLRLAEAIRNNFDYVSAVHHLHPPATVRSVSVFADRFLESMATKRRAGVGRRRPDFIAAVGELLNDLAPLRCEPTLVGGMALVTLGSPRVTKDFDFLVVEAAREEKALIGTFYRHGFELASKADTHGNILRTIDSQRLLGQLRIDRPKSASFYNPRLGLRVNLLFDFPIGAREVRQQSTRRKIQSYSLHIASKRDLVRMKELAAAARGLSSDLQDLEFLEAI